MTTADNNRWITHDEAKLVMASLDRTAASALRGTVSTYPRLVAPNLRDSKALVERIIATGLDQRAATVLANLRPMTVREARLHVGWCAPHVSDETLQQAVKISSEES